MIDRQIEDFIISALRSLAHHQQQFQDFISPALRSLAHHQQQFPELHATVHARLTVDFKHAIDTSESENVV